MATGGRDSDMISDLFHLSVIFCFRMLTVRLSLGRTIAQLRTSNCSFPIKQTQWYCSSISSCRSAYISYKLWISGVFLVIKHWWSFVVSQTTSNKNSACKTTCGLHLSRAWGCLTGRSYDDFPVTKFKQYSKKRPRFSITANSYVFRGSSKDYCSPVSCKWYNRKRQKYRMVIL